MHPKKNEWLSLALNPATDIPLYRSPRITMTDPLPFERGTDLFAHRSPGGTVYFYFWHWSHCKNETSICQLTTADSVVHHILELVCLPEVIAGLEHDNLMEYLPNLYWSRESEPEK